jgi:hypothetical protein
MPLPAKPATTPEWTEGNAPARTEPTLSYKQAGWAASVRPPYQFMNWILYNLTEWVKYFDAAIQAIYGASVVFDAYVGTGPFATHADINAVMADGAIGPGCRIMILNSMALAQTQQITKQDCEVFLKPGVILTDSGAATGIRVTATGVRIKGGKMSGFGTEAILVDVTSLASMIGEMRFAGNADDINDLSGKGATYALINE